jgi:hypothetical protein
MLSFAFSVINGGGLLQSDADEQLIIVVPFKEVCLSAHIRVSFSVCVCDCGFIGVCVCGACGFVCVCVCVSWYFYRRCCACVCMCVRVCVFVCVSVHKREGGEKYVYTRARTSAHIRVKSSKILIHTETWLNKHTYT